MMACPWLRHSGNAGDFGPNLKGLDTGSSILSGRHSVTVDVIHSVDSEIERQGDPIRCIVRLKGISAMRSVLKCDNLALSACWHQEMI